MPIHDANVYQQIMDQNRTSPSDVTQQQQPYIDSQDGNTAPENQAGGHHHPRQSIRPPSDHSPVNESSLLLLAVLPNGKPIRLPVRPSSAFLHADVPLPARRMVLSPAIHDGRSASASQHHSVRSSRNSHCPVHQYVPGNFDQHRDIQRDWE
jgi:hypothetical protein